MNRTLRNISNIGQLAQEKHVTRASLKGDIGDQAGAARRGALVDRRNTRSVKLNQEVAKKSEVKKIVRATIAKKHEKSVSTKEKLRKKERSYTDARFNTVVIQCDEYKEDVENYIFYLEKHFDSVGAEFLLGSEISPKMRAILVDWLVQVHARYRLLPETLFLTIDILDRYLAKGLATKKMLQLIGVAALSAASKYEEIFPPEIVEYVYITENALNRADVIRMEYKVLSVVDVTLGRPTVIQFLRRISTYFNQTVHIMAKFISENMVVDYKTCHLNPSLIAATSVWLAAVLDGRSFPPVLYRFARVSKEKICEVAPTAAAHLLEMQKSTRLVGIKEKYSGLLNAQFRQEHVALLRSIVDGDLEGLT
uniref:Cyclin N-terminal domain-containing protein n=1 Tax=Syphacia muris TaxID=451379 RepID=A0A0N5ASS2_9BILA